jgi:hypothetical protein
MGDGRWPMAHMLWPYDDALLSVPSGEDNIGVLGLDLVLLQHGQHLTRGADYVRTSGHRGLIERDPII